MNNEDIQIKEEIVEINDNQVKLMFVQLYQTFLVWVGSPEQPTFDNLALALGPHSTQILSQQMDTFDKEMATKLSRRFNENRPVYVGYNYPPANNNLDLKLEIDKRLIQFVKSNYGTCK